MDEPVVSAAPVPDAAAGRNATARARRALGFEQRPEVWALELVIVVIGVGSLAADLFPISVGTPRALGPAIGACALGLAVATHVLVRRFGRVALVVTATAGVAAIGALVSLGTSEEGVVLTSFAYVWIAIYCASFFTRRALVGELAFLSGSFAAALVANGLARAPIVWVIITATVWTVGLVLERAVDRLRQRAETDELTGLLNRRGFAEAAAIARPLAARAGIPISLAVIDLDDFKVVNDTEGHDAGDKLLVEAASAWQAAVRAGDRIGRFGGDEFVLLLPGADEEGARGVLERLAGAHPIRFSAGVACWLADEELDACVRRADGDLYARKRSRG